MTVAEGYTINVLCDGKHSPGLERRDEFYGITKREAHAKLRAAGWRLGADFTAYCRACRLKMPRGVEGKAK
jgi:hypothetical protein